MQCFQCGSEQTSGNAFCTKCGARLAGAAVPESRPGDVEQSLTVSSSAKEEEEKILRELKEALKGVDSDDAEAPREDKASPASSKRFVIAGVVASLVLAAVVGFELLRRRAGAPAAPPAPIETVLQPPAVETPAPSDEATRTSAGKFAAILEAIDQHQRTKKALPPTLASLGRAYAGPEAAKDGWGQKILYLVDLTDRTFVLRSVGPDGKRDTADDMVVDSEGSVAWLKQHEALISEWRAANSDTYAQLAAPGSAPSDPRKLEAARKLEEERKSLEAETATASQKQQEQERKRMESARLEEERRRQTEAKREEEARQAKAREEAQRQQQKARRAESLQDNFIGPLDLWDAPATWEIVKDKDLSALRIQGLGFLKKGQQWDNYKVEFEIKVNKESAGWVLRAQSPNKET